MAGWLVAFATMPQTTWLTRQRQATAAPGGRGRLHKGLNARGCDGWLAGRLRRDTTNHLADTAASTYRLQAVDMHTPVASRCNDRLIHDCVP